MQEKKEPNSRLPKYLKNYHYAAAYMSASGMKDPVIAKELQMSEQRLREILKAPEIQKLCEKIRWKIFGQEPQKRFMNILPKAVTVAEKIMEDETVKPSVRAETAFRFMDRALGKPLQPVDVGGSMLRDLIETIRMRDVKAVDSQPGNPKTDIEAEYSDLPIDPIPEKEEEPLDEMSEWVKNNI